MDHTDAIARSIAKGLGDAALVDKLAALKPSELSSLMLAVLRAQAARRSFADVRRQFDESAAAQPSTTDARVLAVIERRFYECAPAFAAVDVAPVLPLGVCALTGIDQNNVLSALRSLEVLADPTAALALEVARRRRPRGERAQPVHLCASARVLRMQPLPPGMPHFSRHFRLLCLVSAAATAAGDAHPERAHLVEHVGVWLRLLAALGVPPARARVRVSSSTGRADPDDVAAVAAAHGDVAVTADDARAQGRAYYQGAMIGIDVQDADGSWLTPADGGAVAWTQALLDDKRERLFTSGFGAEFAVKRLGPVV